MRARPTTEPLRSPWRRRKLVGAAGGVVSGTRVDPSQPATVQTSFDGAFVHFAFGIPRGNDGARPQGPQGQQGEVTLSQLQSAIAGTSNNTNSIATLDLPVSDPPTQSEVQQIVAKLNDLITGLRRSGP